MAEVEQMKEQRVEGRNVSMYPQQWAVVHQVAKDTGLASTSAGLRFIIHDWQRVKLELMRQRHRVRIVDALLEGHITEAEAAEALGMAVGGDGDGREA